MKQSKSQSSRNRFMRIITIPIRALGKAKELYVRSMRSAERMSYVSSIGGPGGQFTAALPKSFSARQSATRSSESGSEDYAELVRAASARSYGTRIDVDEILRRETTTRECSRVGMGKIDEDKACDEFVGDGFVNRSESSSLFPRSRSYAVAKRRV